MELIIDLMETIQIRLANLGQGILQNAWGWITSHNPLTLGLYALIGMVTLAIIHAVIKCVLKIIWKVALILLIAGIIWKVYPYFL